MIDNLDYNLLYDKLNSYNSKHFSLETFFRDNNRYAIDCFENLRSSNFTMENIEWREFYIDDIVDNKDSSFKEVSVIKVLPGRCVPLYWNFKNYESNSTQYLTTVRDLEYGQLVLTKDSVHTLTKGVFFENKLTDYTWSTNSGVRTFWILRIIN